MFVLFKRLPESNSVEHIGCAINLQDHPMGSRDDTVAVPVSEQIYVEWLKDPNRARRHGLVFKDNGSIELKEFQAVEAAAASSLILEPKSKPSKDVDVIITQHGDIIAVQFVSEALLDNPEFDLKMSVLSDDDPLSPLVTVATRAQDYMVTIDVENVHVVVLNPVAGVVYEFVKVE